MVDISVELPFLVLFVPHASLGVLLCDRAHSIEKYYIVCIKSHEVNSILGISASPLPSGRPVVESERSGRDIVHL